MANQIQTEEALAQPARRVPGSFEFIRCQVDGPVARLTLQRPEHNLLNEQMLRELAAGIAMVADNSAVRLIVLDAAGKVFSAGVDIGEYTVERAFPMLDAFHAACIAMVEAPKPVLVIVDGAAIGGGAELVAYGDLVVATPHARFALPEITIGMFPPLASTMLPHLVGPKRALELVLTGEAISAERARDLGLVNRLVPEAQLQAAVNDLIGKITAQSGAVLGMAKRAILSGMGMSLRDSLQNSMNIFLNELYRLEDSQEGLRALLEKRQPQWKNR
jgi:cyclohexa-1,5-dienecarbonyl-CoA hydratase